MKTIEQTIREYYNKLIELNSKEHTDNSRFKRPDEMGDLMLQLQNILIKHDVISVELFPNKVNSELEKEIANIFLKVRREYQDDEQKIQDFSYISVAFEWLTFNNVEIKVTD